MNERVGRFIIIDNVGDASDYAAAIDPTAIKDLSWNKRFKKAYINFSNDNYYSVPCDTEQDFIDLINKFDMERSE